MKGVVFTDYALMRMRDITRGEAVGALEAPRSRHFFNTKHGKLREDERSPQALHKRLNHSGLLREPQRADRGGERSERRA